MSNGSDESAKPGGANQHQILQTIADTLFASARPRAVYGEPVTSGNYTLITASEVASGGGGGGGSGFGPNPQMPQPDEATTEAPQPEPMVGGTGAGMGGGTFARPVAVIVIGPAGVEVKPVFDVTKIGIACATTLGAMLLMLGRMRKASRG
jgi:uncharacterized spore protein YtfJ